MGDDAAEVHDVPGVVLAAVDGNGTHVLGTKLVLDLVDDGVNLAVVVAGADDEEVGDIGDAAQVDDENVMAALVVDDARNLVSEFLRVQSYSLSSDAGASVLQSFQTSKAPGYTKRPDFKR